MPVDVIPLDSMNLLNRPDHHWRELSRPGDPMYTLSKMHHHAVAIVPRGQPVNDAAAQISMFSSEEPPASPSASPDFAKDLADPRGNLMLTYLAIAAQYRPQWMVWENVPGVLSSNGDGILEPSSAGWGNSGMGSPTECLTLNISEWPQRHARVFVVGYSWRLATLPQRYFLSAKACRGILRRAEKRGKELPPALRIALEQVASMPAKMEQGGEHRL